MDYKIRTILSEEDSVLQDFLYEAIFVPEGTSAPPKSIINQPGKQQTLINVEKMNIIVIKEPVASRRADNL